MIPPEVKDATSWEEALAAALLAIDDLDIDVDELRAVTFGERRAGGIYWSFVVSRKVGTGKLHHAPFDSIEVRLRKRAEGVIKEWVQARDRVVHPPPLANPDDN